MKRAPSRIDKYEVVRRLGSGGMGTVYLARDAGLGREVAIKVLRGPVFDTDDELLARFLQEARATAKLRHTNIVTVYEVGQHDQQPFIVMEFVAGDSLAVIIQQRRVLPLATKLHYLEQICAGLHFAHRAGIVHRDIKPANLMVDTEGMVRILDFGIARLEDSRMTRDGDMMGTVNYMSPEQMLGRRVDHRSDIFAVGTVAYELISYRQAFPGTMQDGLLQRLPSDPPVALSSLCPEVDPELEALINRSLEKSPEARQPDLAFVQAALSACRRRLLQQRGAAFEVTPAPPLDGFAATLHRPRPRTDAEEIRSELEEGERRLQAGDPTSAVNIAERIIQKAPSSVEAHALLVRAHGALALAAPAADAAFTDSYVPVPVPVERWPKWAVPAAAAGLVTAAATAAGLLGVFDRPEAPRVPLPPTPTVTRPADRNVDANPQTRVPPETRVPAETRVPPPEPSLDPQLERARALLRQGELASAVSLLEPLLAETRDRRVRALLDATIRDVSTRVERARGAATTANARELAAAQLALAVESEQLMDRARRRNDYAETTRLGLGAVRQFEEATTEAGREAERRRVAAANAANTNGGGTNPPAPPKPEVPATTAPIVETTNTGTANPPPHAPVVSVLDRERPAIMAALEGYRNAYRTRSVAAMEDVFPTLPRERRQAYERAFKDRRACPALDVQFGTAEIFLGSSGQQANVTVMATYVCKAATAQDDPLAPQADVFQMRKTGDRWQITAMGEIQR